ncbi:hypothetical protein SAMN03159341_107174 [Paenibacillus sp. 1_12]|uniref:hypothetical protein n=1 Tax=Paenibacillus sp. 1_12 TaxID=1566278 RepID=UPI0008F28E40|nr:hypothetical protein [Paenibacillus sp. 1_12]SFL56927.1 hypothetical protein SAMN03159341_107174 [Paenibacillus sp. 1_12]
MLELEWNYFEVLGDYTFNELKQYDVWNFTMERYMKVTLEKWEDFVHKQNQFNEIVILDSSIFQFQIYSLILAGASFAQLKAFVETLFEIISPLNPSLVYLYRENTDDTIEYLEKNRGLHFLERIWDRDKNKPYYNDRPVGAEGYRMFLRDYGKYAKLLFDAAPIPKLCLEITDGKWGEYVELLLKFVNLSYVDLAEKEYPTGRYYNIELNQYIEIFNDYCLTPNGGKNDGCQNQKLSLFFMIFRYAFDLRIMGRPS